MAVEYLLRKQIIESSKNSEYTHTPSKTCVPAKRYHLVYLDYSDSLHHRFLSRRRESCITTLPEMLQGKDVRNRVDFNTILRFIYGEFISLHFSHFFLLINTITFIIINKYDCTYNSTPESMVSHIDLPLIIFSFR